MEGVRPAMDRIHAAGNEFRSGRRSGLHSHRRGIRKGEPAQRDKYIRANCQGNELLDRRQLFRPGNPKAKHLHRQRRHIHKRGQAALCFGRGKVP